jgi:hypothetical protein
MNLMSTFFDKAEKDAANKVKELIEQPDDEFDPWELFPSLYGSYSAAFDLMAVEVLQNIAVMKIGKYETIAHEMFREMLCNLYLCDYGGSPRGCFATRDFQPLIEPLIKKWAHYVKKQWDISPETFISWLEDGLL